MTGTVSIWQVSAIVIALGMLRRILGIGLADLSRRSGVSVRELHRIERGEALPHAATAEKLDQAFLQVVLERAKEKTA